MKYLVLLIAATCVSCARRDGVATEVASWQQQARQVTITRDDWGIPHVHGKTDADAVFGLMYAQAEDDFNRVETNYLNAMGRLAEAEGEAEVYRDLRMKLFIDPDVIKAQYEQSPSSLKALMNAWAAGLNYYLYTHPTVAPRAIRRFEPWMALSFSEGSIGGDIERVNLRQLEAFYGNARAQALGRLKAAPTLVSGRLTAASTLDSGRLTAAPTPDSGRLKAAPTSDAEPTGSNGFAIAPSNTSSGFPLLLINPHTSFFFRAEVHASSDEGLNAYGAVTWGQFFVYQGFNERAGWMHTSSGVDNIDEYLETIVKKDDGLYYRVGAKELPLEATSITVPYRTASGMARKAFTVYRTHRGPIVRVVGDKWVGVRLMHDPVNALTQSYTRAKAKNYAAFKQVMELHTNSSNNTVFADADGNIAYFHSNFIPKRDPRFDWTSPVDGSDPATEWQGVHGVDEAPNVLNPAGGWIQNTNNWPFSAAGANSPKQSDFPRYVETGGENPRGVHAVRVLGSRKDFTLESLVASAYDRALPEFEIQIPLLVRAYDQAPAAHPLKARLSAQAELLRRWDHQWSVDSVPTALAVFWGDELWQRVSADAQRAGVSVYEYMASRATAQQRLEALAAASDKLEAGFGQWTTPWGEINRFQRLTGDITHPFDDAKPSIPVGFTSARWGSLASFGARSFNTKKLYGTSGNSFVAVVEFGKTVRAKAITAGGQSGDPSSRHFNDQAARYSTGDLRDVYFYPSQLEGHIERRYHPGD